MAGSRDRGAGGVPCRALPWQRGEGYAGSDGQVIAVRDGSNGSGGSAAGFRFVGRARELNLLLAAARHPPSIVLVEGEAGIGKSRLIGEAAAALAHEERCLLVGFCHPLREPLPYGPVVDALQKAGPRLPVDGLPASVGPLARLLPSLAEWMPPAPEHPQDPQAERRQLLQALRAFLEALGPAVMVVEDVHWVDEATRELLLLLARDLPKELCLVMSYRAEDLPLNTPVLGTAFRRPPGTSGTVLHLTPLGEADVRELATAALGGLATDSLVASLFRRSEGLPLVAEEDLITLREHSTAPGGHDAVARLRDADVPHGLREAVTERLTRLSPQASAVVDAAAVLEVPSAEELLCEVAGLGEAEGSDALVEALQASILRETDPNRYAFRHALARQVAYLRLAGPSRRRLHAGAVRVLEAQTPPPRVQIAHHTLALGDLRAWIHRAEEAADQATSVGDTGTAAALLRQMLQQPDLDEQTRSRVARALAAMASEGVDFSMNAAALRTILADHRLPPRTRGEIRVGLGLLIRNTAADRTGFDELARAVDELGDTSLEAVPAMTALAMDGFAGAEQSEHWLARAEHVVRDCGDAALVARVQATRLTVRSWTGDPGVWAAVEEMPRDTSDIMVLRQTARALYNVGDGAIEIGEDHRAAVLTEQGLQLARASGYAMVELRANMNRLRLDALAGHWDGAREGYDAYYAEYPDTAVVRVERDLFLGTIGLARGLRNRAAERFERAADEHGGQQVLSFAARAAAGTAAVGLAQRDPQKAWAVARNALVPVRRALAWPRAGGLLAVAVESALESGERGAAEDLAAEIEEGLHGSAAPAATADLHTARGLLAEESDLERAAGEHAEAYRLWQEIGRPYHAARAAELRARALAPLRPPESSDALARAIDVYTDLDATADLARAQKLARRLGLVPQPAPGRRGYGNQLSPREKEVADLLVAGATNQDIADALFLSRRTVEHHVARVLRKLGATRDSVAAALRDTALENEAGG